MDLIEVGYGTSKVDDAFDAGVEAAAQALRGIGAYDVSVVLVFASVHLDLDRLLEGISTITGEAPLVGMTSAGEICNGIDHESVVVAVLASSYIQIGFGLGRDVSVDWSRAVHDAVAAESIHGFFEVSQDGIWPELTRKGESVFSLLFSPGATRDADSFGFEILEELKHLSSGLFPIMGAGAAGGSLMGPNYVLLGKEAFQDSLLVVVFRTSLTFGIAMAHGYQPTNRRATVTRAEGHEAVELDGRPAADVYVELLGVDRRDLEGKHITRASGRPCGVPDPCGQYSLNVANFFTDQGGVRLAQPVAEGATLVVMETHHDRMVEAGPTAVRKALWRGQIRVPAAVLVFPCALRLWLLGERAPDEIAAIQSILPDVPVVGAYSFGEQGLADDGVNRHNNEVITLLVLGNELSPAARTAAENRRLLAENLRMTDDLRLRNDEQALLLDTIQTQIWYLTDAQTYGALNKAHADFLALARSDAAGKKLHEFLPEEVARICREGNEEVFRTGRTVQTEEWVPNGRGERRLIAITKTPELDASGRVSYVVCAGEDITDRRKDEEQLRLQSQVLSNIRDNVILVSKDMRVIYANQATLDMFGSSPEMFTEPCYSYFRGLTHVCEDCPVARVLEDEKPHQAILKLIDREGQERWRFNRAFPYHDAQGGLVGAIEVVSDYTEQKLAQDAIADREERLDLALKGGSLATWDWDIRTGSVVVNEQWYRLLDLEPGEIQPQISMWHQLVHPDDQAQLQASFGAHLEDRAPFFEVEHRILSASGEWKWVLTRGKVTRRDEKGKPLRMVGTKLDLTERRQLIELSLAQRDLAVALGSSTDLKKALELVIDTVLSLGVVDCGGVYLIDENTGAMDLVVNKGVSSEFMESCRHFEADSPQSILVERGMPIYGAYESLLPDQKDETRLREGLRAIGVIPILHEGRPVAAINVASHTRDVLPARFQNALETIAAQVGGTIKRIRSDERHRETWENLQSLFNSLHDFLFVLDDEGKILHTNPVVEHRLGYSLEELIGQPVTFLHPPDRRDEAVHIVTDMLAGHKEFCPVPLLTRTGETIPVETKVVRAKWSGRSAILGISRDITERLKGEQERLDLERQLFQAQKSESLGRMAGAIAHHFNNLLGAIIGNLELAGDDLVERPDTLGLLENAMTAAQRAAEISRLMLTYVGQFVTERSLQDVTSLWTDVITMLHASTPPKVRLLSDLASEGAMVVAEAGQMRQLLVSLVANAWEAIGDEEGEVMVSSRVVNGGEIETGQPFPPDWLPLSQDYLCIEVADTGCGIDPEALGKIFDPFYTTKFMGRGMGLAVSAGIAKAHGGAVCVGSRPGRGSVFRVYFPVVQAHPIKPGRETAQASYHRERQAKILVADDEMAIRSTARAMLTRAGFDVVTVEDGVEAVEALDRLGAGIDLVVLDLGMPRMGGWQALEALRARHPGIPVILISGYDEATVMQGKIKEQPQAFIQKPFHRRTLIAAVEEALKESVRR